MRFEYKYDVLLSQLNHWGDRGWRFKAIYQDPTTTEFRCVVEREIEMRLAEKGSDPDVGNEPAETTPAIKLFYEECQRAKAQPKAEPVY